MADWAIIEAHNQSFLSELESRIERRLPALTPDVEWPVHNLCLQRPTGFVRQSLRAAGCTANTTNALSDSFDNILNQLGSAIQSLFIQNVQALVPTFVGSMQGFEALEASLRSKFVSDYNLAIFQLQNTMLAEVELWKERSSALHEGEELRETKGHFTTEVTSLLESVFSRRSKLSTAEKSSLSNATGLSNRQVAVWFANQRQRRCKVALPPGVPYPLRVTNTMSSDSRPYSNPSRRKHSSIATTSISRLSFVDKPASSLCSLDTSGFSMSSTSPEDIEFMSKGLSTDQTTILRNGSLDFTISTIAPVAPFISSTTSLQSLNFLSETTPIERGPRIFIHESAPPMDGLQRNSFFDKMSVNGNFSFEDPTLFLPAETPSPTLPFFPSTYTSPFAPFHAPASPYSYPESTSLSTLCSFGPSSSFGTSQPIPEDETFWAKILDQSAKDELEGNDGYGYQ